jgi:hypothetical protein
MERSGSPEDPSRLLVFGDDAAVAAFCLGEGFFGAALPFVVASFRRGSDLVFWVVAAAGAGFFGSGGAGFNDRLVREGCGEGE